MKMRLLSLKVLLFSLLGSYLLSGCYVTISDIKLSLKLKENEDWAGVVLIYTPIEFKDVIADANDLQSMKEEFIEDDVLFDWSFSEPNDEGEIVISLFFSGNGYEKINDILFNHTVVSITTKDKSKIISIDFPISEIEKFYTYSNQFSFQLEGGTIISSNGNRINATTVIWENPKSDINAEMEIPNSNRLYIGFIIAGSILIGIFVVHELILKIQRKEKYNTSSSTEKKEEVASLHQNQDVENVDATGNLEQTGCKKCLSCGAELPEMVLFCTKCGSQQ